MFLAFGTARAAPVTFATQPNQEIVLENGGVSWFVTNRGGTDNGLPGTAVPGSTRNGSPGLAVNEASLIGTTQIDGFDSGLEVWIGQAIFIAPDTVDVTGKTLTAGPRRMSDATSDLNVTVQYAALAESPTLRVLVTLENPTPFVADTTVRLLSNLGSDGDTVVLTSSDGEQDFDTGDSWVITADDQFMPGDPIVTHIIAGPSFLANPNDSFGAGGRRDHAGLLTFSDGIDAVGVRADMPLMIAPHRTFYLLFFAQLNETNLEATTAVRALAAGNDADTRGQPVLQPTVGDEALSGLAVSDLPYVLNWNFFNWYELTGAGATWLVSNRSGTRDGSLTGRCRDNPGLGVVDAFLGSHRDAFDNGLVLYIDDTVLVPPIAPTVDSRTLTTGAVRMSGLDVSVQYAAATLSPTLRMLATFTNQGATDVSASVKLLSNFGSDEDTDVLDSSSGDFEFTRDDRWLATKEELGSTDVINVQAFAGPGAPVPPLAVADTAFECTSTDGTRFEYQLTVPAGQTRRLLFFHAIAETDAAAVAAGSAFDANPPAAGNLLEDVSPADLFQVVNWDFCATESGACDDGDRCTADTCAVGPGCAHAMVARAADFLAVQCHTDGLAASVQATLEPGRLLTSLSNQLAAVRAQEDRAETLRAAGKNGAAKRALGKAIKLLRGIEATLRKKKARTALTEKERAAFTQTSSDLRADLQALRVAR